MKQFLILTGVLFILTGCIGAGKISTVKPQGDNVFPKIEGIDLLGKNRQIPDTFAGAFNIVTVAFEREHQRDVDTWIGLALEIMHEREDVRFYEIPLIYKINGPYRMFINNGMRSGIPDQAARERTITVYTDRDAFTRLMEMQTDRIYTLLLNERGEILWRVEGAMTPETQQGLISTLKKLSR